MTDAPAPRRLAELYRASMVQSPAAAPEALLSALDGTGSREFRDEIFSAAAADPAQAAVLRTLASLRYDIDELQREVRGLRLPTTRRIQRPLWGAMAASVALAAVVAFGLRPGLPRPDVSDAVVGGVVQDTDRISSVSFESSADSAAEAILFRGSFDS